VPIEEPIGLAYAAALHGAGWDEVVAALAQLVRAERGLLVWELWPGAATADGEAPARLASHGFEPAAALRLAERLRRSDRTGSRLRAARDGVLESVESLRCEALDEPEGQRWNELVRALRSQLRIDERSVATLVLCRARGARRFAPEERQLLRRLLPHLARALRIGATVARAEAEHAALVAAIDSLPFGVAVLDDTGHLVRANRALARLADGDGLSLEAGALRASAPAAAACLAALLPRAGAAAPRAGGKLAIERPSGRHPLHVVVQPVRSGCGRQVVDAAAETIVLVADPERRPVWPAELLNATYGLTDAEVRVARRIATGASLASVAAALAIRPITVRNHLKQIFEKTRTHRQAELVALLRAPIEPLAPDGG
jgi:DNA-binding CsgD family transcriptional regulator/PAS domain-containing protein